jgi:hypothetical protein
MARQEADSPEKSIAWAGWVVTALPSLLFVGSAFGKLSKQPQIVDTFLKAGYSSSAITAIGVIEVLCLALYLVPRTAVLGAVLLTGYLGGAVSHHVRLGEPWFMPVVVGVVVWAGIYLRERRLPSLLPLRRDPSPSA